jgi:hypothetical protein
MSFEKTKVNTKNQLNDSNDPFDEFEFKPLTEGLGFHRNKETPRSTNSHSNSEITSKLEFRNPNLKFDTTAMPTPIVSKGLNSPLPRNQFNTEVQTTKTSRPQINVPTIEDDSIAKAQTAVNEILKNLNHKKQQEESLAKNKKKMVWKSTTPSLLAGFLDSMLVTAGFLLMLISMLTITQVDLISNLSSPGDNHIIWLATASLLTCVTLIYMVVFRTYMGFTPGEWAFDQRCGNEMQQASSSYILKITARTLLVMVTGFLPLTLISALFGTDFVGLMTGLQIQKQTYV